MEGIFHDDGLGEGRAQAFAREVEDTRIVLVGADGSAGVQEAEAVPDAEPLECGARQVVVGGRGDAHGDAVAVQRVEHLAHAGLEGDEFAIGAFDAGDDAGNHLFDGLFKAVGFLHVGGGAFERATFELRADVGSGRLASGTQVIFAEVFPIGHGIEERAVKVEDDAADVYRQVGNAHGAPSMRVRAEDCTASRRSGARELFMPHHSI